MKKHRHLMYSWTEYHEYRKCGAVRTAIKIYFNGVLMEIKYGKWRKPEADIVKNIKKLQKGMVIMENKESAHE